VQPKSRHALDRNADCDAVARLTSCRIRTDAHLHVPVSLSFPKAPFTSHDLDCINVKDVFYVFYSVVTFTFLMFKKVLNVFIIKIRYYTNAIQNGILMIFYFVFYVI